MDDQQAGHAPDYPGARRADGRYRREMGSLQDAVDAAAERSGFSGVVRVDRAAGREFALAYGLADRAHQIPNTVDTLFATASGTKGFTALAVMSLVESGTLDLTTTARSVLGKDLPLIADDVTVEHLLAHRSGIGDYLDEDDGRGHRRLRDAGTRARAGDDRAVPARSSAGTRRCSPRASGSPTTTAATSCSR